MPAKRKVGRESWPRGLYEPRSGYFIYRERIGGQVCVIGYVSIEEALTWVKENARLDVAERRQRSRVTSSPAWQRMRLTTYRRAQARARTFGREILSPDEFDKVWRRAGGFCELTGIPLEPRPDGCGSRIHPWVASLDRIDNANGYTYANTRIVCAAMNIALNEFGESVFRRLAAGLANNLKLTSVDHEVNIPQGDVCCPCR
jgi:hypothetical protein